MIVSLTAYNRPDLLRQVIDTFAVAAGRLDEDVTLVAHVEPSDQQNEISGILAGYDVTINDHRLGLQRNTLGVLEHAWQIAEDTGTDFVLHLEDDLVLAPDALEFAAWTRDTFRDDAGVWFAGLTNTGATPDPADWLTAGGFAWFDCHVWGTWRPGWEELHANWPHHWPTMWAQRVNDAHMRGRFQVRPWLSRSASIGVYGTHCNPTFHESHNPHGDWAADVTVPDGDYVYAGHE